MTAPLLLPATVQAPPMCGAWPLDSVQVCDAITLLKGMPSASVNLIATDPPYGLGGRTFVIDRSFRGQDERKGSYSAVNEEWDTIAPVDWMAECERVLKPGGSVVIFAGRVATYHFAHEGLRLGWRLVNDVTCIKPDPPPNFTGRMMTESTERLLWFCPSGTGWTYNLAEAKTFGSGRNLRDVWRFRAPHTDRLHPTQKPLDTLERIVRLFTNEGDLVVDPFAGSGTTLVAAQELGRRYLGCDILLEYVNIARRRLAQPYTLALPFAEAG